MENDFIKYMKRLIIIWLIIGVGPVLVWAQQQAASETFDIITYKSPKGWKKETQPSAVLFGIENSDGGLCLITLFKPVPAISGGNSKANFAAAWKTLVKETVTVKSEPQMQPSATENGWTAESGAAEYESDGQKGIVLLVTVSSGGKMVNILILTNTTAFQQQISDFLESIVLPKAAAENSPVINQENRKIAQPRSSNFKFNTTNFDDGWTGTEQDDWVEVVKGKIKVLIHYPKEGTIFPADPEPLTNAAWNILVAPRYSSLKNYKTAYINTYNRPYLGMGYATENATRKQVFVLLFRQGDSGWLEFVAPDKDSFIQQFRFDPETVKWDTESDLLKPLVQMANYNKFAVAESDFTGTWTSDFTGVQQLYSVYTGNYAGMNINQSKEEFIFGAGNSYSWKLLVVSGKVGNMNYSNAKSAGTFSVLNNWQVRFSQIESKAKTYHAHWSCIKGARLLHLLDANAPGSGIYTVYGKK
jgi:hypothetical protein